jgi:excisionase family DNA binding protein
MAEEFLTVAEVAAVLKLNQQTVRNWIDQGRLPALRVGRRVRIRRTDFDRLIEGSYVTEPAPTDSDAGGAVTAQAFWDGEVPAPTVPAADDSAS